MSFQKVFTALLRICWAIALSAAWPANGQEPAVRDATVSKTYNGVAFAYRAGLSAERSECRVYRLSYPSPVVTRIEQNNTIPADYYLPKTIRAGGPKRPAVICLHILDGNEPLTDMVCTVLAARGIPAISFKLPYYGERGLPRGPEALADDPALFVSALKQVGEDIRRTIDLLASRPEVDPERIGIAGISLGGIIAATAAGAEPRLHRAGLILAGGDLLTIIHHAEETRPLSETIRRLPAGERAAVEANIAAVDPLRFAPALSERALAGRVLMINAAEDEVIPRRCTEKLAAALGLADRVEWHEGLGHYTVLSELPRVLQRTADFFAEDLPREASNDSPQSSAAEADPLRRLAGFLRQVVALTTMLPDQGRCHAADLGITLSVDGGRPFEVRARWVRAADGRFTLCVRWPEIGEIGLGQGRFPWALAGNGTSFVGSLNPVAEDSWSQHLDPLLLTRLRLAAGAAGSVALAPEVFQRWIIVERDRADAGEGIRIASTTAGPIPVEIRLAFQSDGCTPEEASFSIDNVRGTVRFHEWRLNAESNDSRYEPPEGLTRRELVQSDLFQLVSAMLREAFDGLYLIPTTPNEPAREAAAPEINPARWMNRYRELLEEASERPGGIGRRFHTSRP